MAGKLNLQWPELGPSDTYHSEKMKADMLKLDGGTILKSATAPASPQVGDVWFDLSSGVNRLKYFNGSAWKLLDVDTVYKAGTQPSPAPGDGGLWWDTGNDQLKVYNGIAWQTLESTAGSAAKVEAHRVSGVHPFNQSAQPTGAGSGEGALWYDPDVHLLYLNNGTGFKPFDSAQAVTDKIEAHRASGVHAAAQRIEVQKRGSTFALRPRLDFIGNDPARLLFTAYDDADPSVPGGRAVVNIASFAGGSQPMPLNLATATNLGGDDFSVSRGDHIHAVTVPALVVERLTHLNVARTSPGSPGTIVPFESTLYPSGQNVPNTPSLIPGPSGQSNTILIHEAGVYMIWGTSMWDGFDDSGDTFEMAFYANNFKISERTEITNHKDDFSIQCSAINYLANGSIVQMYLYQSSQDTIAVRGQNDSRVRSLWMGVVRIA